MGASLCRRRMPLSILTNCGVGTGAKPRHLCMSFDPKTRPPMPETPGQASASPEAIAELTAGLPDSPVLTVDQIAKFLLLPRSTAYKACNDGTIPCVRFGRHIRISRAAFIAWFLGKSGVSG